MSNILPGINFKVRDGGLGLAPNLVGGVAGVIGMSSQGGDRAHVVTSVGQIAGLFGTGPLARALRDALEAGAMALVACRVPTLSVVPGSVGEAIRTAVGSALGNVTPGEGNTSAIVSAEAVIEVPAPGTFGLKCVTGGNVGTAQFAWRTNDGTWSAPFTPGASYRLQAANLDLTLGFGSGGFVQDDTWSAAMYLGGSGTVVGSEAIEPSVGGMVRIDVLGTGGRNTGRINIFVNDVPIYFNVTIPSNGQYEVPGVCHLSFNEGVGAPHFIAGDSWGLEVVAPGAGVEDIVSASLKIRAAGLPVECILVAGATGPSTWAALDVLADTEFKAKGRFMFFLTEAADVADGDTTPDWVADRVAEPAVAGSLVRVAVCAGYVDEGADRRSIGGRVLGHIMGLAKVSFSPGRVRSGSIGGVTTFGPTDEGFIAQLDTAGFITLRKWEGLSGAYITNGRMLVDETSDFRWLEYRRVMDRACRLARLAGLRSAHDEGDVSGLKALESDMQGPLDGMVGARLCAAAKVTVPVNQDVVSTSTVAASVGIQPIPAMRWINVDIGFTRGETA